MGLSKDRNEIAARKPLRDLFVENVFHSTRRCFFSNVHLINISIFQCVTENDRSTYVQGISWCDNALCVNGLPREQESK